MNNILLLPIQLVLNLDIIELIIWLFIGLSAFIVDILDE